MMCQTVRFFIMYDFMLERNSFMKSRICLSYSEKLRQKVRKILNKTYFRHFKWGNYWNTFLISFITINS